MTVEQDELAKKQRMLEIEDQNAMRDAQRKMAWLSLIGMVLYPIIVVFAGWLGLSQAAQILGSMAPTYFVSVAAIVAAFYGKQAYTEKLR